MFREHLTLNRCSEKPPQTLEQNHLYGGPRCTELRPSVVQRYTGALHEIIRAESIARLCLSGCEELDPSCISLCI